MEIMSLTLIPTDIIFAGILALRRLNYRASLCKDIRRLIVGYLYETVNEECKYGNIRKYTVVNKVNHGLTREWYESGEIWSEEMYKNGYVDGMSRLWWKSGELESERMYNNGNNTGISRGWYITGILRYENDVYV